MKHIILCGVIIAATLTFTGCDKRKPRPTPAPDGSKKPGTEVVTPGTTATLPLDAGNPGNDTPDERVKPPTGGGVIPPVDTKPRNPEYGIKIEGKTGYVKSPYDSQGRPIDVRGLPPGTEVEDPYTAGRTLLVP